MPRSKTRGAGNADANSESAMVIDTAFLDGLQGEDVRKSLEAINELRTCGLGDLLDLPEIVVCGDQSAGKSSLLARLTQVPFPQAEGICTRFATQITLRNTDTKSVTIKILPGSGSSTAERKKLLKFTKELKDFENFQQLIDEATTCMGLKALGNGHNAFSTHRLCIEITGPECGHFSLLDLPGLIRTDTDVHTRGDLDFVKRLHDEVLANNRAIILAVMPATIDLAVHEILTICQRHDPTGSRTLGIITKPDRLHPGSQQEKSYLDLFKNKGKKLQLGWYVVMNQPIDGKDSDFELRARHEHKFVGSGNWVAVPSDRKGIDSLRRRVSRLRVEQHKRDLPDLLNETTRIMRETLRDLNVLGDRRTDVDQQRKQLRDLSIKVSNIVCGAVSGNFNNDFFDVPGRGKGIDPRHLSAVVAQLQDLFAARIEVFGHKYQFTETHDTPGTNTLSKHDWSKFPGVRRETDNMTRAQAIEWVAQLHMHTRGLELPGAPSTSLVWDAFREQSGPWEELAKEHIIKVERACSILMKEVILKQAPRDLRDNLLDHVDGYLLRRFRNAEDELQKLIEDKKSSTTMCDPSYPTNVSKLVNYKLETRLDAVPAQASAGQNMQVAARSIRLGLHNHARSTAENALDHLLALYESKLAAFIMNVTEQVVNRHLIHNLDQDTFSPKNVDSLPDDEVTAIAAEPIDIANERDELERKKAILIKSRDVFHALLYPHKRLSDDFDAADAGSATKRMARKTLAEISR